MKETMGQIIRRLRKEKNLSQEALAEQLGVTFQAISKWETDAGMPDISQVVPLAHVFGVSTDVLFGIRGTEEEAEVWKEYETAQSLIRRPITSEGLFQKYRALQDGLKRYPNHRFLLMQTLETGIALAYPENDVYDAEHAHAIYQECIQYANLIISYSSSVDDILRAHMIMVFLHAAYGNFPAAASHAEHFPVRADFNFHDIYAVYAHWKKDYATEVKSCQYAALYYLEGLLDITIRLAKSYELQENDKDAEHTLETVLGLIRYLFREDDMVPPLHVREQGDMEMLLAGLYWKEKDVDRALEHLAHMVDYAENEYAKIDDAATAKSPLFKFVSHILYQRRVDGSQEWLRKLTDPRFDGLKSDARYKSLLERMTE